MAGLVEAQKKVALLHRYTPDRIKETNAAYPYLQDKVDTLTFKSFDRLAGWKKHLKSLLWILYAPLLVCGRGYSVIYCDDSYPFYPILVKLVSPRSRVILRLGDFHLMYYFNGWVYQVLHAIEKVGWRMSDGIIAISEAMAQRLLDEGFNSYVVKDPIDPKDFPITQRHKDSETVMFHGTLTRNKGVDILLEAARRMPKTQFMVVGTGPDRRRLERLAPTNVCFMGWVPFENMHFWINHCKVGVALRSNNPGNEYVVTSPFLQYGIMGKPCLVTKRKVFGSYRWQFTTVKQMVEMLEDLLTAEVDSVGMREAFIRTYGAERIAGEIWQILMQA